MFHTAAFTGNVATTANTDIAALTDSVLSISNSHFRLVDNYQLIAAAAMSATLQRAKLDSPSLRLNGNPYILPPNIGATPEAIQRVQDLTGTPYLLPPREEIACLATSGVNPGPETFTGVIWVSSGYVPPPAGRVQWVRLTSSTAAVANAWTQIALTFESALPSGYWSVVGLRHFSTNGIACRLLFPGQIQRPGVLSVNARDGIQHRLFLDGSLGEFGRFVNDNPFLAEVLVNGTDNSHELYVGLVQVGGL